MVQQGIRGDMTGVELPQTQVDPEQLLAEKRAAAFAKSSEYKELKKHFETRIKHYQTYLPDGKPVATATKAERDGMWVTANIVITEFQQVIDLYETAKESVDGREST